MSEDTPVTGLNKDPTNLRGDIEAAFKVASTDSPSLPSKDSEAHKSASESHSQTKEESTYKSDEPDTEHVEEKVAKPYEKNRAGRPKKEKTDLSDQELGTDKEAHELEPISPPSSWSAEDKAHYAKLPRELQSTIAKRESDRDKAFLQKTQEIANARRYYEDIDRVIAPRKQSLELAGIPPSQAVAQLFATNDLLNEDPVRGAVTVALRSGADLSEVIRQLASHGGINLQGISETQPRVDPALSSVKEQVQWLIQNQQNQVTQAQMLQKQATHSEIQSFKSETDSSGKPLRPHFDSVVDEMEVLIPKIRQKSPELGARQVLDKAYQTAVWANPEVREQILKSQEQEAEKRRIDEAKAKAKDARRAGSSVTGFPGGSSGKNAPDDLRGTILSAMNGDLR